MALALSLSGVVIMPESAYADFVDEDAPRFVVWPGQYASRIFTQDTEVTIAMLPTGLDFLLREFRWVRARISLSKIAKGEGWYPLGIPLGVIPPQTMRPTPLYDDDGQSRVRGLQLAPPRPTPVSKEKQSQSVDEEEETASSEE